MLNENQGWAVALSVGDRAQVSFWLHKAWEFKMQVWSSGIYWSDIFKRLNKKTIWILASPSLSLRACSPSSHFPSPALISALKTNVDPHTYSMAVNEEALSF